MLTYPQFFHIIWATHNSRYSERMLEYKVKTGEPVLFNEQDEILITSFITQIAKENNFNILAYSICKDHIHLVLVCEEEERDNIVRKLKGKCTHLYKQHYNITENYHLWAQKYNYSLIENDAKLENVVNYVFYNRLKHGLPELISENIKYLNKFLNS